MVVDMLLLFVAKQPNGLYAIYSAERDDVTETNLSRADVERAKLCTGDADRETRNYNYLGIGDGDPPTLTRWEAILRMMQIRNPARAEHLATVGTAQAQGATTDKPKPKPEAYRDEASIIVDDVICSLSGGIGPRFDEMWESIGEWMRNEVAFCAACHSDPIAALVKDRDDARRELAETKARLAALESASMELVNALPRCAGKWVGGSGGHAIIEPCSRMATVFNTDCIYGQTCDEHRALIESGADDAIWAELAADAAAKVLALVAASAGNG